MSSSDQENYASSNLHATNVAASQGRIRCLNDGFRTSMMGGQVNITLGVHALGADALKPILKAVQEHDRFDADNDPHGEHDFGSFMWGVHKFFWKIDYYDEVLESGSPDPADPNVTCRVLTIMLAHRSISRCARAIPSSVRPN